MRLTKHIGPTLLICIALSACNSSTKATASPEVVVDDSMPVGSPVSGILNDEAAPSQLSFRIDEDAVLNGFFAAQGQASSDDIAIVSLPTDGELTLRSEGDRFRYQPDANFAGSDSFVYSASGRSAITVSISITQIPDTPMFADSVPLSADQGMLYSLVLQANDGDGDTLRFSSDNLPEWLTLDPGTGLLSGVPRQSDIGLSEPFSLTVNDGTGLSSKLETLQIDVVDINDPPSLNVTQIPRQLFGGEEFTFKVFPDDQDNDGVVVSVEPHPAFDASVDGDRVTLKMRDFNEALASEVVVVAQDARGAVNRAVVPVFLYPRTASGKGTTVSGVKEGKGVHIIILGDGYAGDQELAFERHVEGVLTYIRADEGISGHLGAFNIHRIYTPSAQPGSDDSDLYDIVDTAFDSTYNCRAIPRLVCADTLKMYTAALTEYPKVDQIILLVNDIRFGGSGSSNGRVAVTSAFHPEIALHEMGHSLADLADEYVDSQILDPSDGLPFEEGRFKNVSLLTDPSLVPWAHWIDPALPLPQIADGFGIGVFEGGYYQPTDVYRATPTSRMREYDRPFGPINTEQWILRLYTLTNGFRSLEPASDTLQAVTGDIIEFRLEPIFGPEVQGVVWSLNGEELTIAESATPQSTLDTTIALGGNEPLPMNVQLQGGNAVEALTNATRTSIDLVLPPGQHELVMTLSDISGRIRFRAPHVGIYEKTWSIGVQ